MMRVLLTGATGYIGSAVLDHLIVAGHEVIALVRSQTAATKAESAGARGVVGDVTDRAWLTQQLTDVDAAIHLAVLDPEADDAVIKAVETSFGGTRKRFVYTSGIWSWGDGDDIAETDPYDPGDISAWRPERVTRVTGGDYTGVAISPTVVYGRGGGMTALVFSDQMKDESGALKLVGDGTQHWATVYVEDLADLYVLAVEKAAGGNVYIGASGHNPTVREMAEAAVGTMGAVAPETPDDSRARFGPPFADALLLDEQAFGRKAQADLGWKPTGPDPLTVIRQAYQ